MDLRHHHHRRQELVADIHDRMPVILAPADYARWLGQESDPRDLMRPFPGDLMRMWPISIPRSWSRSNWQQTRRSKFRGAEGYFVSEASIYRSDTGRSDRVWNRIPDNIRQRIVDLARSGFFEQTVFQCQLGHDLLQCTASRRRSRPRPTSSLAAYRRPGEKTLVRQARFPAIRSIAAASPQPAGCDCCKVPFCLIFENF
jgi:SOS response associated peptidase (SRAP)